MIAVFGIATGTPKRSWLFGSGIDDKETIGGPMYYIRNGLEVNGAGWRGSLRCSACSPDSGSATGCRCSRFPLRWRQLAFRASSQVVQLVFAVIIGGIKRSPRRPQPLSP